MVFLRSHDFVVGERMRISCPAPPTRHQIAMTRYSTDRNPVTGCLRRRAKRKLTTNARWMGLGAGEVSSLHLLHTLAIDTAMSYATFSFLLAFLLTIQSTAAGNNIPGLDLLIDMIMLGPVLTFETLLNAWMIVDHVLFDIPDDEYIQPRMMTAPKNLRIDSLSDPEAIRLTRFTYAQLRDLYRYFGIATLLDPGETLLRVATGHLVGNTACCYRIHPEEAYLFTMIMIKIATGMTNQFIVDNYIGGDYARWSHAYPFILRHIDARFDAVIGFRGLARVVDRFPEFNEAIE